MGGEDRKGYRVAPFPMGNILEGFVVRRFPWDEPVYDALHSVWFGDGFVLGIYK